MRSSQDNFDLYFGCFGSSKCPGITQFSMYLTHFAELAPNSTPPSTPPPAPSQLCPHPPKIISHKRNADSCTSRSNCSDGTATSQPVPGLAALTIENGAPVGSHTNLFTIWPDGPVTNINLTTTIGHAPCLQADPTSATIFVTEGLYSSDDLPPLHHTGRLWTPQALPSLPPRSPGHGNNDDNHAQPHPKISLFPPPSQSLRPAPSLPALSQPSLPRGLTLSPLLVLPPLLNMRYSYLHEPFISMTRIASSCIFQKYVTAHCSSSSHPASPDSMVSTYHFLTHLWTFPMMTNHSWITLPVLKFTATPHSPSSASHSLRSPPLRLINDRLARITVACIGTPLAMIQTLALPPNPRLPCTRYWRITLVTWLITILVPSHVLCGLVQVRSILLTLSASLVLSSYFRKYLVVHLLVQSTQTTAVLPSPACHSTIDQFGDQALSHGPPTCCLGI